MGALTHATLVAETVLSMNSGTLWEIVSAVRIIPHDSEGNKPRGKAGKGFLLVGKPGQTHADVLRAIAGYYEQEGDWQAFTREQIAAH